MRRRGFRPSRPEGSLACFVYAPEVVLMVVCTLKAPMSLPLTSQSVSALIPFHCVLLSARPRLLTSWNKTSIHGKTANTMAEEKRLSREPKEDTTEDSETKSTSSSEAAENPFDDGNEALSMASRSQSVATTTQTETSKDSDPSSEPKSPPLPSHSPLVFANYPPLWTSTPRPRPNPQASSSSSHKPQRSESGFSAATLSSVMSSGSKDASSKKFNEKDPSNRHEYLQKPDRPYTHAKLNIFGRDIGGLGKPPSLRFRRQKGK